MSQWTHLAGLVRLDSFGRALVRGSTEEKTKQILAAVTKALGKTCNYESDGQAWDQCAVPCGSEGSLQYKVFPESNDETNALSWGCVAIWGDLRDFGTDDLLKVKQWFEESLKKLRHPEGFQAPDQMGMTEKLRYMLASFGIRDALLSIEVEGSPHLVLLWDSKAEKTIELHQRRNED